MRWDYKRCIGQSRHLGHSDTVWLPKGELGDSCTNPWAELHLVHPHFFFFSFVILFIYFKTSHFLLLEVFLWFLTALNHYWHQACRVYCTCTLYPVLNRSRTNGHMPSKHGNKQISLKSSLSLMSTIESRNGWKSEPMTEWNLYLCPWENISQCHFILMVCRAEVTSKLIYYVLQHKYLGWFWEEEEGRTD